MSFERYVLIFFAFISLKTSSDVMEKIVELKQTRRLCVLRFGTVHTKTGIRKLEQFEMTCELIVYRILNIIGQKHVYYFSRSKLIASIRESKISRQDGRVKICNVISKPSRHTMSSRGKFPFGRRTDR